MEIVALDVYSANPGDISWDELLALGNVTMYDRTTKDKIVERIGGAEIVLVNKVPLGGDVFSACPGLKYIGLLSTGYDIIDLDAAGAHGITVCNAPAYSTAAVVQHTFALLFELCAHTSVHSSSVREGKWARCPDFCYWDTPLTELSGKTLGVVGFGKIGSAVARAATAFGMNVLACARNPRQESGIDGVQMNDFESLIKNSDIISLHCPQTAESLDMICADTIAKMRDGVIILNTARGGLINEADMSAALKSGKVAAYGADVLKKEPPAPDCPLINAPNTVITPHIAWAPLQTRERLIHIAIENVRAYLRGQPQNKVN